MRILGIIPARFASSRFPGKPLIDIGGKSMIERVYAQAKKSSQLNRVIIATDNQQIFDHVSDKGCEVLMTSPDHVSGTDRCAEALTLIKEPFDYVVNIQGDEPFIDPKQIDLLASLFDGETELATLVKKITNQETLFSSNIVKVVANNRNQAIYFSRSPIPHVRNIPEADWMKKHTFYKHIGMYGYRADILKEITLLKPSGLEVAESLEQLRWIENGYIIKIAETEIETMGIDSPEDLDRALDYLKKIS